MTTYSADSPPARSFITLDLTGFSPVGGGEVTRPTEGQLWPRAVTRGGTIVTDGDKNYIHNQVSASASWDVIHNLGKYPSVEVVDSGGSMVLPDVVYVDSNTLTLLFGSATSGKAYVN